jgi:hypothetical protein
MFATARKVEVNALTEELSLGTIATVEQFLCHFELAATAAKDFQSVAG